MENKVNRSVPVEFELNNPYDSTDNNTMEKKAFIGAALGSIPAPLIHGFQTALGTAAAGAMFGLANSAINAAGNAYDMMKYKKALRQAIMLSPALQHYDLALLESYLPIIIKSSPTVASEPRLLANYLESMLDAEGHLNLSTFSELANMEHTLLQNRQIRDPFNGALSENLAKGMAKKMGENFVDIGGNTAFLMFHGGSPAGTQTIP